MLSFIRGKIVHIEIDHVVVDHGGLGLKIFLSQRDIAGLSLENTMIYTELVVREDDISLYGFIEPLDREIFQRLQKVSGIGVKTALGILNIFSGREMINFIIEENMALLTRAPGIGRKTASRMILELKDNFAKDYSLMEIESGGLHETKQELREALLSLGYGGGEIQRALTQLDLSKPIEVLLREALGLLVV
ncbi:MAG: Holliday junction branch migration protein RuvA [Tissierellia bacterium]|nr:Holliday junction branch migration protein RuvA [Tissierellia bacterium]